MLSKKGRDSITGKDGMEYIFKNIAVGPFLAAKYGNPEYVKLDKSRDQSSDVMSGFRHRQGIVRLVNYNHHHPAGHVGLWDCDHFVESRDWTHDTQLIGVEFWETPGA